MAGNGSEIDGDDGDSLGNTQHQTDSEKQFANVFEQELDESQTAQNRQLEEAQCMLEKLRVTEDLEQSCAVLDNISHLANARDASVRRELMEIIPIIAAYCNENMMQFCELMRCYILPVVVHMLYDEDVEVRKSSHATVLLLLQQKLVQKEEAEDLLISEVVELVGPDSGEDLRVEAVALMSKMARLLDQDITERLFLSPFLHMVSDPLTVVRMACASCFGAMCSVVGVKSKEIMLSKFQDLCRDDAWKVRKACIESFSEVSASCSWETRLNLLPNVYVNLLRDPSLWVRLTAYQELGPFISTFASPRVTSGEVVESGRAIVSRTTEDEAKDTGNPNKEVQAAGGCSQVGRRDDEEDGVSGQKTAAVFEGKEDGTAEVIAHLQSGNGLDMKCLKPGQPDCTLTRNLRTPDDVMATGMRSKSNAVVAESRPDDNIAAKLTPDDGAFAPGRLHTDDFVAAVLRLADDAIATESRPADDAVAAGFRPEAVMTRPRPADAVVIGLRPDGAPTTGLDDAFVGGSRPDEATSVELTPFDGDMASGWRPTSETMATGSRPDGALVTESRSDDTMVTGSRPACDMFAFVMRNDDTMANEPKPDDAMTAGLRPADGAMATELVPADEATGFGLRSGVMARGSTSADNAVVPESRSDNAVVLESRSDNAVVLESRSDNAVVLESRSADNTVVLESRSADNAVVPESRSDNAVVPESRSDNAVVPESRSDNAVVLESRSDNAVVPESRSADNAVVPESRSDNAVLSESRSDNAVLSESRSDNAVVPESRSDNAVLSKSRSADNAVATCSRLTGDAMSTIPDDAMVAEVRPNDTMATEVRSDEVMATGLNPADSIMEALLRPACDDLMIGSKSTDDTVEAGLYLIEDTTAAESRCSDGAMAAGLETDDTVMTEDVRVSELKSTHDAMASLTAVENAIATFMTDEDILGSELTLLDAIVSDLGPDDPIVAELRLANAVATEVKSPDDVMAAGMRSDAAPAAEMRPAADTEIPEFRLDDIDVFSYADSLSFIDEDPVPEHQEMVAVLAGRQNIIPQCLLENFLAMVDPSRAKGAYSEQDLVRLCAFNLPAVAHTLGPGNWHCIRDLFVMLSKGQWRVRRTVASSLYEIAVIEGEHITHRDLLPVFDALLRDIDEVRIGVLLHLSDFLKLLRSGVMQCYLPLVKDFLCTENPLNWRFRQQFVQQLVQLCEWLKSTHIVYHIAPLALGLCQDKVADVRTKAFTLTSRVLSRIEEDKVLNPLCSQLVSDLAESNKWLNRQIFCHLCKSILEEKALPPATFATHLLPAVLELGADPVPNVRLAVACVLVQSNAPMEYLTETENGHGELLITLQSLQHDEDRDVRYFAQQPAPCQGATGLSHSCGTAQ